jgi:hypothetical protein
MPIGSVTMVLRRSGRRQTRDQILPGLQATGNQTADNFDKRTSNAMPTRLVSIREAAAMCGMTRDNEIRISPRHLAGRKIGVSIEPARHVWAQPVTVHL